MNSFETSFNASSSIGVSLVGNALIIHHLPQELCQRQMMIVIKDIAGLETYRRVFQWKKGQAIDLSGLNNGTYSLSFLFQNGKLYWAFFSCYPPEFVKNHGRCWFTSSSFAVYNSMRVNSWPTSHGFLHRQLLSDIRYQLEDNSIRRCAEMVARAHLFPYTKMKAVHDFVASEIAYDTDALISNRIQCQDNSALATLRWGKGVCQGYTNLSVALLRVLGIPAMQVVCYALGAGANGGWDQPQNRDTSEANHVLTAAFINHRWCLMDITWDSDLEFKGGVRRERTGCGISHRYFDMTPTMLSLTHKLQ